MGFRVLEFRVRFCSHCGWPTCRLCTWALTSHCRIPKFGPSPFPAPSKRTVHVLSSCHFELSYFFPSLPTAAPPPYRNRAAHPRAYDSASPAQLPSLQHTTPQQLEPSLVSAVRSASNCVPNAHHRLKHFLKSAPRTVAAMRNVRRQCHHRARVRHIFEVLLRKIRAHHLRTHVRRRQIHLHAFPAILPLRISEKTR